MYTRRGDKGETSLYGAKRVKKDSARVEAYGTIDELNSLLGLAISESKDEPTIESLKEIQRLLFVAGGDAASEEAGRKNIPRITPENTKRLETMTDELISKLPQLKNFILPGGTRLAATLHVARSVCRRAERRLVTLSSSEGLNPELVPFFNRLSSYLFNLSRFVNKHSGVVEDVWSRSSA